MVALSHFEVLFFEALGLNYGILSREINNMVLLNKAAMCNYSKHPPQKMIIGNFRRKGDFKSQIKFLKESMMQDWNFGI